MMKVADSEAALPLVAVSSTAPALTVIVTSSWKSGSGVMVTVYSVPPFGSRCQRSHCGSFRFYDTCNCKVSGI